MNSNRTPERAVAFCAALAETCNVGKACKAIGIGRTTAYEWREADEWFAGMWDKAMKIGLSALEDEAHRRAFEGVDKPLTHQGQFTYLRDFDAIDPDTGKPFPPDEAPVLKDENGNPRVATMKEYSDTLAIFLLKAHDPEKYRDNARLDLGNAGDKPFKVSDTDTAAKLAQILAAARARQASQQSDSE